MAIQPIKPQRKDDTGQLLQLGGAAVGGLATGSLSGALAGAQVGGLAAGALGGQESDMGAVERRVEQQTMQAPPVENPLQTIEKAQMALSRMPEDQRAQFEPALRLGGAILRKQSQGVA